MIKITDDTKCTGCEACANICPVSAIEMISRNAFYYPEINLDKCISCKLCQKVCPVENAPAVSASTNCLAAFNKTMKTRRQSSSGGLFRLLAEYVIKRDGIVYGAAFDSEYSVLHFRAVSLDDVLKMQGAKYAQSRIGDIYIQVKGDLANDNLVLFSGTPCQVAGLKNYLGKDYDNLLTVDFVCHGIPAPGVWKEYIKYRMKADKSDQLPKRIDLRSKVTGWDNYQYSVIFDYGAYCYQALSNQDPYMKAFVSDKIIRESCSLCQFKGIERCSDFTLGDFWGIEELHPEMTDNNGTSLLLVHSDKARMLWNILKNETEFIDVLPEETYKKNPSLIKCAKTVKNRNEIISNVIKHGFHRIVIRQNLSAMKNVVLRRTPKKGKIGIVTITNNQSGNYGNVLQNYAVQQVYQKLGYESETIRNLRYIEQRRLYLLYLLKLTVAKDQNSKRNRKFEEFKIKHIRHSNEYVGRGHENYDALNEEYYKFSCGSDQVWNPNYKLNDNLKYNLLEFADPKKRIAYAASIGIPQLPEKVKEQYRKALSEYHFISVREDSAADIVESLTGIRPPVFIDPTLMLTSEEWDAVSQPVKYLKDKNYVLRYCLGEKDEMMENTCNRLKNKYKAEVVELNKNTEFGPSEFIWLIKNAKYIVTDSFHGTIFSIIYRKPFAVFRRQGEDNQIFSRLDTLLNLFGLQNHVIGEMDEICYESYDVHTTLEIEQSKVMDSLKKALR